MGGRTDKVSWDTLRAFVAVYRNGSISKAADELGMAPASVSSKIVSLERRLGGRLFERTHVGMVATDRGKDFADRVSRPVDALAKAVHAGIRQAGSGERTVFIAGPAEFLSMVVLPRITQMLPGSLRLNVRFGVGDELIESMTTGQVDMIVSTAAPRRSGIAFEPIFDEELVLVAHPCWTEQAARSIDTIPILAYDATLSIVRRYWRVVFGRRPSRLRRAVVVPDMRVLAGIAARGAGMTVLPKYLAEDRIAKGDLVVLHEPETPLVNTLYVATRRKVADPDSAVEMVRTALVELSGSRA